ncbi:NAD(P)/FAD-dependent oxidoreductase [Streptomyces sp. NPDC097619]|uniref:protoporphyrinogen/coproporphyrinogen oxidase n=1 Tax=Streptomyces sp. NPDC097619 TaxID=3157228 RepID=UPI00332830FD
MARGRTTADGGGTTARGTDIDVAVVGGGIAGLTAAHRLRAAGRSPVVLETADEVGGRMKARRVDGWIVEEGTETLAVRGYDATWRLIKETGLDREDGILKVNSLAGVWRGGRAHAGTGHWFGALTGSGLSLGGRSALAGLAASVIRQAGTYDTRDPAGSPLGTGTVAQLARGRHREVYDYVLQPAVATGWGWDARRAAAAPLVATMISTWGLLGWRTYRGGMDALAKKVAAPLDVRTGHTVEEVKETAAGVRLVCADGSVLTAREVVLAVPAPVARRIHPGAPAEEQPYLEASTYSPMIRVTCLVDRPLAPPQRRGTPSVYALLIPEVEDGRISGLTFEHAKAANRAPAGHGLVSILTAPDTTRELLGESDAHVLGSLLGSAEKYAPGLNAHLKQAFVHRFPHAAPDANGAALRLHRAFLGRPSRAVEYAGDWIYQRPSSEAAVQAGELAAQRLLSRG